MGRPRGFNDDEVAEAFLNVFWLRGYAGTSISHLTQATGLLTGSLYSAFGSKEDMFRIAIDRYVAQLGAAISSEEQGIEGVRRVLDTVVRLTAGDPERRGCLILNTIPESAAFSAETRGVMRDGLQGMRLFLRHRLREAAGESVAPRQLEALIALTFAASVAIRVLGRAGQDRRQLQDIADGAMAAVRRALGD